MSAKQGKIDWPAIRADYEGGTLSNRRLAEWYRISETAIRKQAKAEGWVRPSSQPKPRTEVRTVEVRVTPATPETTSAEAIASRGRNLTLRMMDELEAVTARQGDLMALVDTAVDEGNREKGREAVAQAVSLKQRAEVLKSLSLALKTLGESATPAGKKAEKQRQAEETAGRFGVRQPPRLIADNTK